MEWRHLFLGRAYWNVGKIKRLNSISRASKERAFDESVGIEPTYEGDGLVTPWTPRAILRPLPVLFALQRLYRALWKEAKAYKREFMEEGAEYAKSDPAKLSEGRG